MPVESDALLNSPSTHLGCNRVEAQVFLNASFEILEDLALAHRFAIKDSVMTAQRWQ